MLNRPGTVFDPAAMARLAGLIEDAIKKAEQSGLSLGDQAEVRRAACRRVIAAIQHGESDPAKLREIAVGSDLH